MVDGWLAPSGAWPACPGFLDTSGPFAQRLRARRAPEWVLWPHACACPAAGAILSAVWRGSRGGPIARARSASYRPRFRRAQLVSGLGLSSRASVGIALRVCFSATLGMPCSSSCPVAFSSALCCVGAEFCHGRIQFGWLSAGSGSRAGSRSGVRALRLRFWGRCSVPGAAARGRGVRVQSGWGI